MKIKFRVRYENSKEVWNQLNNYIMNGYHPGIKATGFITRTGISAKTGEEIKYCELFCTASPIRYFMHKLKYNKYAERVLGW